MCCVTKICVMIMMCCVTKVRVDVTGYVLCYKDMCCDNWICVVLQRYVLL